MTAGLAIGAAALAAVTLGALSLRTGTRMLANRTLSPTGGLDNLAVTLITLGVILIGWGAVGPVLLALN